MAGDAETTIRRFWDVQDSRDYSRLSDLFTDDAVVVDPVYGRFEGKAAVTGFFAKMVEEMPKLGVHFEALEIAGDDHAAWCQWVAVFSDGRRREGAGLYRVRDGKLSYYRDYFPGGEG